MRAQLQWLLILLSGALLLAVLMQGPQWLAQQQPAFQGIPVTLNSDEEIYLARVQEALSGRPERAAEAFTGHPNLVGTQAAFIESLYGRLFAFTGWRAWHVLTFLDAIIPALLFLSLYIFFRLCGFNRWVSLGGATAFCLIELYNLNRPIHMRSSWLVMLWGLNGTLLALRHRIMWAFVGGALIGLSIGIYVWTFTFAWIWLGLFFLVEFGEWATQQYRAHQRADGLWSRIMRRTRAALWWLRPRKPVFAKRRWEILFIVALVGVLVGLPFIAQIIQTSLHPYYEFGVWRSGMHPGHMPESWPYSILFGLMVVALAMIHLKDWQRLAPYRPAVITTLAAFVYMNQQVIHGTVFNFVSHGIFSLLLGALCVLLIAMQTRPLWLWLGVMSAVVYCSAIAYDGRFVLQQWQAASRDYSQQHLATALPVLDELPRGRFVSDPKTLALIAGATKHDVVYSVYLKNILMPHVEIAARYCLTQLPVPPAERNITDQHHLVHPDANAAFGDPTIREQEVAMVEAACRELDLDPAAALQVFEVQYVLWNKQAHPEWNLERLQTSLTLIQESDTWSLWQIDS